MALYAQHLNHSCICTGYSSLTMILLAETDHLSPELAMIYFTISIMSLASHLKTTFTDPGSVPESAVPVESMYNDQMCHPMCRYVEFKIM